MKYLLLAVFLAALPAAASSDHSLEKLVAKVLEGGTAEPINANMAQSLGYGHREVPSKGIQLSSAQAKDGMNHGFSVIIKPDANGKPSADSIELIAASIKRQGNDVTIDGYIYQASTDGKLVKVFHNFGPAGNLRSDAVATNRAVNKAFKQELKLFMALVK